MILTALLAIAAVQQPTPPPAPVLPASPVADVLLTPARGVLTPGDTLRFRAEARDSAGQPMANVRLLFRAAGGRFEGSVDSTGLVTAGSTGTIPLAVIALVPGSRPFIKRTEVRIVAGPAARITVAPRVTKLVVGQRLRLSASVTSEDGDARPDTVAWRSSNRAIVRVDANGVVTAAGPGGGGGARASPPPWARSRSACPSRSWRTRSHGWKSSPEARRSGRGMWSSSPPER